VSDSKAVRGPQRGNDRGRERREADKRTSLPTFYRQVVAELRKVVWPTQEQLVTYFLVVMVFVLVMIAVVSVLDLAFGKLIFWVFSGGATQ
jgi:preprotein translocase subunit SecE